MTLPSSPAWPLACVPQNVLDVVRVRRRQMHGEVVNSSRWRTKHHVVPVSSRNPPFVCLELAKKIFPLLLRVPLPVAQWCLLEGGKGSGVGQPNNIPQPQRPRATPRRPLHRHRLRSSWRQQPEEWPRPHKSLSSRIWPPPRWSRRCGDSNEDRPPPLSPERPVTSRQRPVSLGR